MKLVLAALVLLATMSESQAQADPSIPAMRGSFNCARWLLGPTEREKTWILGYMSGLNTLHTMLEAKPPNPINQMGSDEDIFRTITAYCKKNEQNGIGLGGIRLFLDTIREKLPPGETPR